MPSQNASLQSRFILGMRVDGTSYWDAAERILGWAKRGESRYVCVACVNNVMQSRGSPATRAAMNGSDLTTPDGMPLVWGMRRLGLGGQQRVYGPDLMQVLLAECEREGVAVGFYGGTPETLRRLTERVRAKHPALRIGYLWSPPFRPLTAEEDRKVVEDLNRSGVRVLFVGIGSPKQDLWMAEHRGRVSAVMVGVGAAFDFLAGAKRQAPLWMRNRGLEWLYRLIAEPKRLWRRYLLQFFPFAWGLGLQLVKARRERLMGRECMTVGMPAWPTDGTG